MGLWSAGRARRADSRARCLPRAVRPHCRSRFRRPDRQHGLCPLSLSGGRELMSRYLNNILLALLWAALTGSFTLANFAFGLLLGWLALYLVREQLEPRRGRYHGIRILSLAVLFIKEL